MNNATEVKQEACERIKCFIQATEGAKGRDTAIVAMFNGRDLLMSDLKALSGYEDGSGVPSAADHGFNEMALAAIPLIPRSELNGHDDHVPAVYSLMVRSNLTEGLKACAVLDAFHSTCPVKVLDDFAFVVFNPTTGIVLEPDQDEEDYTHGDDAHDLVRISEAVPHVFEVTMQTPGDEGQQSGAHGIRVVADRSSEALERASAVLWTAPLERAECVSTSIRRIY